MCLKPYSNDLRQRVVQAYEKKEGSQRELARRFQVSLNFVYRLLKRFRQTGRVEPQPHGGGNPPKIQGAALSGVRRLVEKTPDATLKELCEQLKRRHRVAVRTATVHRVLQREKLTRKKKRSAPRSRIRKRSKSSGGSIART